MLVLIQDHHDLLMLQQCLASLTKTKNSFCVFFNQGGLSKDALHQELQKFDLSYVILGDGENKGIPFARQKCFEYIWEHRSDCTFITEIHPDMLFPSNWTEPLCKFLEQNSKEPCVSPGILTASGEWHPHQKGTSVVDMPSVPNEIISLLKWLQLPKITEGFVHPVMHRADLLQQVGGYDLNHLKGKQGYEDDYLLLSYFRELDLPYNWKPKVNLQSMVYHKTMAQRMHFTDIEHEANVNLTGLIQRFGKQAVDELNRIHQTELIRSKPAKKVVVLGENTDETCEFGQHAVAVIIETGEEPLKHQGFQKRDLHTLSKPEITIVTHPFWVTKHSELKPSFLISMLNDANDQIPRYFQFYKECLYALSNVIIVNNEEDFFLQSLRYDSVFFIQSTRNPVQNTSLYPFSEKEELLNELFSCYKHKECIQHIRQQQIHRKITVLKRQLKWDVHNEHIIGTLAKYLYLNGDFQEAEKYFFEAFARNVAFQRDDGLLKYYPWISLSQCRQYKLVEAINSFGILAVTDENKQIYECLLNEYNAGRFGTAIAMLMFALGDWLYADQLVREDSTIQSMDLIRNIYLKMKHYLKPATDSSLSVFYQLNHLDQIKLKGEIEELQGEKHRAIHYYLQTACIDELQLDAVVRMQTAESYLKSST